MNFGFMDPANSERAATRTFPAPQGHHLLPSAGARGISFVLYAACPCVPSEAGQLRGPHYKSGLQLCGAKIRVVHVFRGSGPPGHSARRAARQPSCTDQLSRLSAGLVKIQAWPSCTTTTCATIRPCLGVQLDGVRDNLGHSTIRLPGASPTPRFTGNARRWRNWGNLHPALAPAEAAAAQCALYVRCLCDVISLYLRCIFAKSLILLVGGAGFEPATPAV